MREYTLENENVNATTHKARLSRPLAGEVTWGTVIKTINSREKGYFEKWVLKDELHWAFRAFTNTQSNNYTEENGSIWFKTWSQLQIISCQPPFPEGSQSTLWTAVTEALLCSPKETLSGSHLANTYPILARRSCQTSGKGDCPLHSLFSWHPSMYPEEGWAPPPPEDNFRTRKCSRKPSSLAPSCSSLSLNPRCTCCPRERSLRAAKGSAVHFRTMIMTLTLGSH